MFPNLEISFPYQVGAVVTCGPPIIVKQSLAAPLRRMGNQSQQVPPPHAPGDLQRAGYN